MTSPMTAECSLCGQRRPLDELAIEHKADIGYPGEYAYFCHGPWDRSPTCYERDTEAIMEALADHVDG